MDTQTELESRYLKAASYAQESILGEEKPDLVATFHDLEARLETLWSRDHAEWIAGFYRDAYRIATGSTNAGDVDMTGAADRFSDGDALCECPNPRCPLKKGRVPYQLRRRTTSLSTPETTPMETLRSYLKTHPDAVVIEAALKEIEALRGDLLEGFASFNRDAHGFLKERDEVDEEDVLSNAVQQPQTVEPPGGRTA